MKTKIIALAAVVGFAAASAQAVIGFGITVGLPVPVIRTPVVIVTTPQPPPAQIVEVVPACPGGGYAWTPGYWLLRENRYVWIQGNWAYRPTADCFHGEHHHHH